MHAVARRNARAGFSLIEMSVTLLIIALAVASIVAGAHLLENAKIGKIVSGLNFYKQAVVNFKTKYAALPGDMPGAKQFWNTEGGDGDNRIDDKANPSCLTECLRAWEHLAKANMANGSFTGVPAPDTASGYKIGANVPETEAKGAFFFLEFAELYGHSGNVLQLSGGETAGPDEGALTPERARIIDKKVDDGNPSSGGVYAARSPAAKEKPGCVTGDYSAVTTADYDMTDTAASCRLGVWLTSE